jgi:hypothetical protein
MMCLESAGRLPLGDYRRATLYTTLSPCAMCAGAVLHYQIPRVVIADSEHFQGEEMLLMTRGVEVMSLDFPDAKVLVKEFIELHPDLWAEDSGVETGAAASSAPRIAAEQPAQLPAPPAAPSPLPEEPQAALAYAAPSQQVGGYAAQAGRDATPEPPSSFTPLPPDEETESLPPPSAPPSMYGDDPASVQGSYVPSVSGSAAVEQEN